MMAPTRPSLLLPLLALLLALPLRAQAPALHGRLLPADEASPAGLVLQLRAGAWADSVAADSAGRFALALPAGLADTLEVRFAGGGEEGREGAAARYLPALLRLPPTALGEELRLVLVPRRWTVPAGRFAGQRVEVELRRAFALDCPGCPAFYRRGVPGADAGPLAVHGWPDGAFPLRVAFDREYSAGRLSARDSVAFWRVAREVEAVLGMPLFRPVGFAEAMDESQPDNVVLVWVDPSLRAAGLGSLFTFGGRVIYGSVRLRHTSLLESAEGATVVAHELLHALGFGHTCAWPSLLAPSGCGMRRDGLTLHDVAYTQLALRVEMLQRRHAAQGIEPALAAAAAGREGSLAAR